MAESITTAPVFIIGAGRSGTTLFRLMLNRHHALRVPSESWFIRDLVDHLPIGVALAPEEQETACRLIADNPRWKDWGCSEEVLREVVLSLVSPTLAEVIDAVFRRCSGMGTKPLWGDKTPHYSYCARQLHSLFPNARFIHLVRDGRDVCTSMVKLGWYGRNIRRIARRWSTTVETAGEIAELAPRSYREVRFESLVMDPEGTLRDVCAFLGIPFDPAMLAHQQSAADEMPEWEKSIHPKELNPPDALEIGRWQQDLMPWQLLVFEALSAPAMGRLGLRRRFGSPPYRLAEKGIRWWASACQGLDELRYAAPSIAKLPPVSLAQGISHSRPWLSRF